MTETISGVLAGLQALCGLAQVSPNEISSVGLPPIGGNLSIVKIVVMLVLLVPWLMSCPWIHKDSQTVRAPKGLWGSVVLAVGAVAFVIWLLLPYFLAGLLIYVLTMAAVFVSYLAYRNGRVDPSSRVRIASFFASTSSEKTEAVLTKMRFYDATGQIVMPPPEDDQLSVRAYNLAQDLLYDMIWRRASHADLIPSGQTTQVRFAIDGVPSARPSIPLGDSEAVAQYLKRVSGLNVEERRRPQQGQLAVDNVGTQVDVVLATAGTTGGQRVQLRVVQEFVQTHLEKLGLAEDMFQRIREINKMTQGLVIVSGRGGSGVTSTLYSLLREHDAFIKQLATLEAEASVKLENITHHSYGDPSKLAKDLASVVRRDPDVIMVDRCPDAETANLICKIAKRKAVLLGIQATDSFTALAKWVKVCGDAATAMADLKAVTCQMLMRLLCESCREAYKPDPQLLAKANIPGEKVNLFYRPPTQPLTDYKGNVVICSKCQGSGYFGRTAVFELLEITDDLRQLVIAGAALPQIRASARKRKMLYLQEQALRRVITGQTSIQEVIRVSQSER